MASAQLYTCMKDAIIVSDFHLGSYNCRTSFLCSFLKEIPNKTRLLILNGDIFDSLDFRDFKKRHWDVFDILRDLSSQTIWLNGNHENSAEITSKILGIKVQDEYTFTSGGKKILVMHGHKFDKFIQKHSAITWIGDLFYELLQRIDSSYYIASTAKHFGKKLIRCSERIRDGAVKEAKQQGISIVACGHTHSAGSWISNGVEYYNSGSWVENPCHYITVKDGKVEILEY